MPDSKPLGVKSSRRANGQWTRRARWKGYGNWLTPKWSTRSQITTTKTWRKVKVVGRRPGKKEMDLDIRWGLCKGKQTLGHNGPCLLCHRDGPCRFHCCRVVVIDLVCTVVSHKKLWLGPWLSASQSLEPKLWAFWALSHGLIQLGLPRLGWDQLVARGQAFNITRCGYAMTISKADLW